MNSAVWAVCILSNHTKLCGRAPGAVPSLGFLECEEQRGQPGEGPEVPAEC